MKTKRTLWRAIGAIAIIALIGFAVAGCDSPTNNNEPPLVNWAALDNAISAAQSLLTTTAESAAGDGSDVNYGVQWAPEDAQIALQSAIEAATAVRNNTAATQAQVDAAVIALNNAITAFNNALRPGTYGTGANNPCEAGCDCGASCEGTECECDDTNQNNDCQNAGCDCGTSCEGTECECDDTNQNNDCGKLPCEGDFTISFEPGITIDITIPTINLGSAEPAPTITLLNPERFDAGSIRWLSGRTGNPVPSAAITNNGATLTLDSRVHENRRGEHRITVEVRIGGALHSAFINFTVEL